jgi:hypothetical protein
MRYEFQCPWCGSDTSLRGSSEKAPWRMQMPCDLCSRDMVVSFDGGMVVSRCADGPIMRGEPTVRIRFAKAG